MVLGSAHARTKRTAMLVVAGAMAVSTVPASGAETLITTAATVTGVVVDASGLPVRGALVTVELLPSDGYRTDGGAQAHILAEQRSDASGAFGLTLPATDDAIAEARFNRGTVNLQLMAVAPDPVGTVRDERAALLTGAGAFQAQMFESGTTVGALVFAPVNIGTLTVSDGLAGAGVSAGLPGPVPDDPESRGGDTSPATPGVVKAPGTEVPMVDQPDPAFSQPDLMATDTKPVLDEVPAVQTDDSGDGGTTYKGDDRCLYGSNQGRWLVDKMGGEYRWQPVGEVHSSGDMQVRYQYGQSANTKLGVAIKAEGGAWKLSGSVEIRNGNGSKDSSTGTLPLQGAYFARRVLGEFYTVQEKQTWCPEGYDNSERSPKPYHQYRVRTVSWQGGAKYDSRDISEHDTWNDYDAAFDDGRVGTLSPGYGYQKANGRTWTYGFGVSAFGVSLTAESGNDELHEMRLAAGKKQVRHRMFGNAAAPPSPENKVVNAYTLT